MASIVYIIVGLVVILFGMISLAALLSEK